MSFHDLGSVHVVEIILGEFCTLSDLCRAAVAGRRVRELMQSCQGYAYERAEHSPPKNKKKGSSKELLREIQGEGFIRQVVEPLEYHVLCIRGPDWNEAGHWDQDGGFGKIGNVIPPDYSDIEEWFQGIVNGEHGGPKINHLYYGGWWIDRSTKVSWNKNKPSDAYYYRANDEGKFDLFKYGEELQKPITTVVNDLHEVKLMCLRVVDTYVQNKSPALGTLHERNHAESLLAVQYLRGQVVTAVNSKIQKLLAKRSGVTKPLITSMQSTDANTGSEGPLAKKRKIDNAGPSS